MAQAIINVLVFLNSLYLLQVPSVTNECSWWKDLYAKSPGFVVTILWKYALPLAVLTALTTPFISTYPMLIIGSEFIYLPQSNSYCPVLKGVIIFDDLHDLDLKSGLVIYASDVLTLSNAYLLIILNKRIRQRVIRMLKCKGCEKPPSTYGYSPSVTGKRE
ncbi:unnamed protein product [Nippostrongylus brasiliensis]|uniref:G_PROTEIN_RECEP_F1_2 domain-containing protein n=1 Tax=Nippostrongylus brasiliensis TaxID=27835 RepID=A0A0N4XUU3_NIPBR|nr:unnamed protein product [Nippostrongylus brasiliensis]